MLDRILSGKSKVNNVEINQIRTLPVACIYDSPKLALNSAYNSPKMEEHGNHNNENFKAVSLKSKIWTKLKEGSHELSAPGWAHAAKSKNWLQWLYWMVIFIAGTTLTLINILQVVNEYYTWPVVTSTMGDNKRSVEFPAVTVCNLNRFKDSEKFHGIFHCINFVPLEYIAVYW